MRSNKPSIIFGFVLIFIGILFILNNTDILDFGDFVSTFWPAVFIIFGFYVIFKGPKIPKNAIGDRSVISDLDNIIQSNAFGDIKVTLQSRNFKGGEIRTTFGDVIVDGTAVSVTDGEKRLNLVTTFGSIKFSVPKDLPIKVHASNVAGDIKIFDKRWDGLSQRGTYESENYENASNRLLVVCSLTFGDIKIY
ncbi:hypothetical protein JW935_10925 [candidate division KSB1 bacterium]|nr:hypothetical protein [candidate division KSB1 bacterium]